jgi:hypothetical protein
VCWYHIAHDKWKLELKRRNLVIEWERKLVFEHILWTTAYPENTLEVLGMINMIESTCHVVLCLGNVNSAPQGKLSFVNSIVFFLRGSLGFSLNV